MTFSCGQLKIKDAQHASFFHIEKIDKSALQGSYGQWVSQQGGQLCDGRQLHADIWRWDMGKKQTSIAVKISSTTILIPIPHCSSCQVPNQEGLDREITLLVCSSASLKHCILRGRSISIWVAFTYIVALSKQTFGKLKPNTVLRCIFSSVEVFVERRSNSRGLKAAK